MRILSLYYIHKRGGFCIRLYRLLNALSKRGHEVHFLSLDQPPTELLDESVKFQRIPFLLTKRSGFLFWALFTLWSPVYVFCVTLRLKPDRLLAFNPYYSVILSLPRLFRPIPLILFIRSLVFKINEITEKPKIQKILSNMLDRIGILIASKIVCMTNAMERDLNCFIGRELKSIEILPNDVPTIPQAKNTNNERRETLVLLTTGVIDKRKNIGYLLDVLSKIQADFKDPKISLIVAGDGPLLSEHKKSAASRSLKCVKFVGWAENISALYKDASLVIHPSLHEGVPNSIMEALAYGLPVLASDTPELREIMENPKLLFDLRSPSTLCTILEGLLRDPSMLEELKLLSARRKERYCFDWDALASEIVVG